MNSLIFIFGLLIGISIFFYIYSSVKDSQEKSGKFASAKDKEVKEIVEPDNIGFRGTRSIPSGSRICPLCGSVLTKNEGLYATKIFDGSERKILIMGCKYCYKDD